MATRARDLLLTAFLGLSPAFAHAQSTDFLQAYQNFEKAKSADRLQSAFAYGNQALALLQTEGTDKQALMQLERALGEFAAQAGADAQAAHYYQDALSLQEADLGPNHPDLVPVLSALTDLSIKAKRYADAAALLERILSIERAAYGERHENVMATLDKLRQVYRDANDTEGVARIEVQMHPPVNTGRDLFGIKGGVVVSSNRYALKNGFATVRVFYGTNRAPTGERKPALYFGTARGELQYGFVDVTIPQTHKLAELETQKQWSDYTFAVSNTDMRRQFVLLESIRPLPKDAFLRNLRDQIRASPSQDIFVFVHGFNNTFEDTARRTAQLAYDLDFDGTPIMYSWPSQGSMTSYAADEDAVQISAFRIAEFLETVVAQSGARRIHLIAHSMGNRVLIQGVENFLSKRPLENRQHIFGQIVFTAPDVDRDSFMTAFDSLRGVAERLTLYASDSDYALQMSKFFNGTARAGAAGNVIIRLKGLDTIDVSGLPADILGHSYFAANGGAVYDLLHLLWRGEPPDAPQRCSMIDTKTAGPVVAWRFDVDKCKGSELLEAGVLLKQYDDVARPQILQQISAQISALTDPSQKKAGQLVLARLTSLLASVAQPAGRGAP